MSSNEPETRQEKEPDAVGGPTATCCQPCTPRRAGAFKRGAEQCAEPAEEQTTPGPSNTGKTSRCGC